MLTLIWKCDQIPPKNSYFNGEKKPVCTCAHTDIHMNGMRGICPRVWLRLSKPRLSQRPVEAQHCTLSIRIHQWHRIGGTQAFILRKTHLQPLSSPFLLPLWFIPPPLLALSYYLPLLLLPPPPHILPRLKTSLPPPLQKEAFLTVTRTQSCMDRDHIAIQHQIGCVWLCAYVTDIK